MFAFTHRWSCAFESRTLAIRQFSATSAPRALCECSDGFTRYEHLHLVVGSPLPEVSSTENVAADGQLAHNFDAPA